MNNGITKENMMSSLPKALKDDESTGAMAEAAAAVLAKRLEEIDRLRIIPNVDALDERVLDMLAVDFKVDWWSAEYPLAVKRAMLKDSWNVHRRLGTRYALEQAISDIYPQTVVQEWWEYGGEPYCFRIMIGNFDEAADPEKLLKIRRAVSQVKRLSAHLDGIDISSAVLQGQTYVGGALPPAVTVDTVPEERAEPLLAGGVTVSGGQADIGVTRVPELGGVVSFGGQCCCAGGFLPVSALQLPELGGVICFGGRSRSAGAFLPVSSLQLSMGESDSIPVCYARLHGRALDMTETEVLHL